MTASGTVDQLVDTVFNYPTGQGCADDDLDQGEHVDVGVHLAPQDGRAQRLLQAALAGVGEAVQEALVQGRAGGLSDERCN